MRSLFILGACVFVSTAAYAVTDAPSYCINQKGEFYPYKDGENCKAGYQVGPGNCRLPTGKVLAAMKDECFVNREVFNFPSPPF